MDLAVILVGKDDKKAAFLFEKGLKAGKPDAESYKFYARALKATGKMEEALTAYRRALELDSDDLETQRELSELQSETP